MHTSCIALPHIKSRRNIAIHIFFITNSEHNILTWHKTLRSPLDKSCQIVNWDHASSSLGYSWFILSYLYLLNRWNLSGMSSISETNYNIMNLKENYSIMTIDKTHATTNCLRFLRSRTKVYDWVSPPSSNISCFAFIRSKLIHIWSSLQKNAPISTTSKYQISFVLTQHKVFLLNVHIVGTVDVNIFAINS